ncbi:MAG: GntR family transcriptional regulator [Bacillota bacterium]
MTESVKEWLLKEITSGSIEKNGKLPSETELAAMAGVSRGTIGRVLSMMEQDGLVTRKHGLGTFVHPKTALMSSRIDYTEEFTRLIANNGYTPGIEYIGAQETLPEPRVARYLSLRPGETVLEIKKAFLADGMPIIWCNNIVPQKSVREPYEQDELKRPVYEFLEARCHKQVAYEVVEIVPVLAGMEVGAHLRCDPNTPCLLIEALSFDAQNDPVMFSYQYFREDKIRFKAVRKFRR